MSTYCISDIHGHWDNFERFLNAVNDDDTIYLLGDVVDKGPESVRILQHVINDKRIRMLLGNHEHMMYCYLTSHSTEDYIQWLVFNHGSDTYTQYIELDKDQQKQISDFIRDLPLNYPDVEVNGRHFYLVHAMPYGDDQVSMADLDFDTEKIAQYVWTRYSGEQMPKGKTVIAGHTPVLYYGCKDEPYFSGADMEDSSFIDIDGGLAGSTGESYLIALKLDDLSWNAY
ncbi:MAG: metallophosphoesterase [Erysipelotrichaceae bacterium]|nr:metallophosphoesterase [Erysipelotrichaceae bacterium]